MACVVNMLAMFQKVYSTSPHIFAFLEPFRKGVGVIGCSVMWCSPLQFVFSFFIVCET